MTSDQPETPPEEGVASLKEAVRPGLGTRLRAYLLTGTVIGAPIMITLYLTSALIGFLDHLVTRWIPDRYNPETYLPFSIPGFGILIMLVGLVLLGAAAANLFGRGVINYGERLVHRVPIIRSVYNGLKQIIETIVAQSGGASLRQVGLIEYPRKGQWVVVFVTNDAPPEISARLGQDMVAVFRSTTPNAAHGFLMYVPRADVIMLDMRAEDAAKLVMSGGIAAPGAAAPPASNESQAARR